MPIRLAAIRSVFSPRKTSAAVNASTAAPASDHDITRTRRTDAALMLTAFRFSAGLTGLIPPYERSVPEALRSRTDRLSPGVLTQGQAEQFARSFGIFFSPDLIRASGRTPTPEWFWRRPFLEPMTFLRYRGIAVRIG